MSVGPTRYPAPLPVLVTYPVASNNALPVWVANTTTIDGLDPTIFYNYAGGSIIDPPAPAASTYAPASLVTTVSTLSTNVGSIAANTGDFGTVATELTTINGEITEIEAELTNLAPESLTMNTIPGQTPTTQEITEIYNQAAATGDLGTTDAQLPTAAAVTRMITNAGGGYAPYTISYQNAANSLDITSSTGTQHLSLGVNGSSTDINYVFLGNTANHTPAACGLIRFGGNAIITSSTNASQRTWTMPSTAASVSFVHTGTEAQQINGVITFPSPNAGISMANVEASAYRTITRIYDSADVSLPAATSNTALTTSAAVAQMITNAGGGGSYIPLASLVTTLDNSTTHVPSTSAVTTSLATAATNVASTYIPLANLVTTLAGNLDTTVPSTKCVKTALSSYIPSYAPYTIAYNSTVNSLDVSSSTNYNRISVGAGGGGTSNYLSLGVFSDTATSAAGWIVFGGNAIIKSSTNVSQVSWTMPSTAGSVSFVHTGTEAQTVNGVITFASGISMKNNASAYYVTPTRIFDSAGAYAQQGTLDTQLITALAVTKMTTVPVTATCILGNTASTNGQQSIGTSCHWSHATGCFDFPGCVFTTPMTVDTMSGFVSINFYLTGLVFTGGVLNGTVYNSDNGIAYQVQFVWSSATQFIATLCTQGVGYSQLAAGLGGIFTATVSSGSLPATIIT